MGTEFRNYKTNTDNDHTDDEKRGIGYSALKLVKKAKSEDNSDDDNAHLTQTKVKNDGIFVFDLDRDLVLHRAILP